MYIYILHCLTGLWSRLSAVTVGGKVASTVLCLAEHNEKNIAAVTLRYDMM